LKGDPGERLTGTVELINQDAEARSYFVSIQKFIPKGDHGQQEFLSPSDTSGLPSWIGIAKQKITLAAEETGKIPFEINIPVDATPGGYYAAIFFTEAPAISAVSSTFASRTGSLILLSVNGQTNKQAIVTNFTLDKPATFAHLPANFEISVENKGNVHLSPTGTIDIINLFGRTVARPAFNIENGRVLPNSLRRYQARWQKAAPLSNGGFWQELGEEWRNFAFGKYKAQLKIQDPDVRIGVPASITFYVLPWRIMASAIGALVVAIAVILFAVRLLRKKIAF